MLIIWQESERVTYLHNPVAVGTYWLLWLTVNSHFELFAKTTSDIWNAILTLTHLCNLACVLCLVIDL